jgi:hypothetical protein
MEAAAHHPWKHYRPSVIGTLPTLTISLSSWLASPNSGLAAASPLFIALPLYGRYWLPVPPQTAIRGSRQSVTARSNIAYYGYRRSNHPRNGDSYNKSLSGFFYNFHVLHISLLFKIFQKQHIYRHHFKINNIYIYMTSILQYSRIHNIIHIHRSSVHHLSWTGKKVKFHQHTSDQVHHHNMQNTSSYT